MPDNVIKITHLVSSPNLGGVQKNLLLKSKYDSKYNIKRNIIFTISNKGALIDKNYELFVKHRYCPIIPNDKGYRPYRLFKYFRKFASFFFVFRLYKALKKENPQIIHSDDSIRLFSQVLVAILLRKFFIWHIRTSKKILTNPLSEYLFAKSLISSAL